MTSPPWKAALWAAAGLAAGAILANRTSAPTSPSPTSKPIPPSEPATDTTPEPQTMTMTTSQLGMILRSMREMIYPPAQRGTTTEMQTTASPLLPGAFDYDQVPLDPGIQAVLDREASEDEQIRLQRERAALQRRQRELLEQAVDQGVDLSTLGLEAADPGDVDPASS